jgi:hypothetical protein
MSYITHQITTKTLNYAINHPLSSALLMGGGLYHSIYTENKYLHIPFVLLFPSIYTGYQIYKYNDVITSNIRKLYK